MPRPTHGIVLFAHGARDPGWAEPFRRIQARLRERAPDVPIELAFLELMKPDLASAVAQVAAQGAQHVTVVPLFLAQGGHLKEDLPRLIEQVAATHPALALRVTPAIGDSAILTDAIADWALSQHAHPGT